MAPRYTPPIRTQSRAQGGHPPRLAPWTTFRDGANHVPAAVLQGRFQGRSSGVSIAKMLSRRLIPRMNVALLFLSLPVMDPVWTGTSCQIDSSRPVAAAATIADGRPRVLADLKTALKTRPGDQARCASSSRVYRAATLSVALLVYGAGHAVEAPSMWPCGGRGNPPSSGMYTGSDTNILQRGKGCRDAAAMSRLSCTRITSVFVCFINPAHLSHTYSRRGCRP